MSFRLQRYRRQGLHRQKHFFAAFILSLRALLCLALALATSSAIGQPNVSEAETSLASARKHIDDIRKRLTEDVDDAALLMQRGEALDIQAKANVAAASLIPHLLNIAARLSELGAAPDGMKEAADIAAQRAQLEKSNRALDAQIKLARLLAVEAGQTAEQISAQRRMRFQARLGERRNSFLANQFWSEFRDELPRDLKRLGGLRKELLIAMQQTPRWGWLLVLTAITLVAILRVWIERSLPQLTATRVPPGRLRRSFLAAMIVLLSVIMPGLIAWSIQIGLNWNSQLSDNTSALLTSLVAAVCFGGYVAGLTSALLSARHPSWRLGLMSDTAIRRIRWLPSLLGMLVVMVWLAERLPPLLNASLITTITLTAIVAAVLMSVLTAALVASQRPRSMTTHPPGPHPPLAVSALVLSVWIVVVISAASLLAGYVAFGSFVIKQVLWTLVVIASAYLLSTLIQDSFSAFMGANGAKASMSNQAAVLLAGAGRVAVALLAIVLLMAPFGEGPMDLMQRLDQLRKGLVIGEAQIRPDALLQALFVLGLSLMGVRILKRWLSHRYLPTTELEPGVQLSAVTLFGYAGVVFAAALALSAAGIGLEQVAWIASALSVGIGFGLQAVVQNFVSGLILLAERPIKVGDWVSLGGVEGDILRINVRATEIQMADRSTVIVPNSEFVTKTVRNVTRSNPLGLVQIKLPMPLSTDAQRVHELILAAFNQHPDILSAPMPKVYLDGIESGHLVFNANGYVSSPRMAYGVRSALLFLVLEQLREAGLEVSLPPTLLLAKSAQPLVTPTMIKSASHLIG